MEKRSQIQMMETIAVLIIFLILVALGLVFYYKMAKSSVGEKIDTKSELSSIQIAQVASTLPEVQCSQQNILQSNCIDLYKLNASIQKGIISEKDYLSLFGFSTITLREIFPNQNYNLTLYSYNGTNRSTRKIATYTPISIYDPSRQINTFGVLVVETLS